MSSTTKPSRVGFPRRLLRPRAFWRADKGATAVEFAMVAFPFFALLGGIIELGLIFMAQVTLDNALQTAAREIRTGQNQSATTSANQGIQLSNLLHEVCHGMEWMVSDCESNLTLSVDSYPSFAAAPLSMPATQSFTTGGPGAVVVVRANYQWRLFFPIMNQALQRTQAGKTLLTSVTTFANEPFIANPPTTVTPTPP